MQRSCVQCYKWPAARENLCLLCRACLGIVQISVQDKFGPADFDFAVDSVNNLLGNLTSRIVCAPPLKIAGGEEAGQSGEPSSSGKPGSVSSPSKADAPSVPKRKRDRSFSREEREKPNIKSLPLSPGRGEKKERHSSRRRRRRRSEASSPEGEGPAAPRGHSGRRRSPSPKASPKKESPTHPPKEWKPSLNLSKRKDKEVPEPEGPPKVSLQGRSDLGTAVPRSPPPPPPRRRESPEPERRDNWDAEEGWAPSEAPESYPPEYSGQWTWVPKGKGHKGKGKGKIPWKGYPFPFWNTGPDWRPKKKNRGLKRQEWWAARHTPQKGSGKGAESAAAGEAAPASAPTGAAEEATPLPSAPEAPPEDSREESDRALRARERSWADASEVEEAGGGS